MSRQMPKHKRKRYMTKNAQKSHFTVFLKYPTCRNWYDIHQDNSLRCCTMIITTKIVFLVRKYSADPPRIRRWRVVEGRWLHSYTLCTQRQLKIQKGGLSMEKRCTALLPMSCACCWFRFFCHRIKALCPLRS